MYTNLLKFTLFSHGLTLVLGGYFVNEQNNRLADLSKNLASSKADFLALEQKINLINNSSKILEKVSSPFGSLTNSSDICIFLIQCAAGLICVGVFWKIACYGTGYLILNAPIKLPSEATFVDRIGNQIKIVLDDLTSGSIYVKFFGGDNKFHHTSELMSKITDCSPIDPGTVASVIDKAPFWAQFFL